VRERRLDFDGRELATFGRGRAVLVRSRRDEGLGHRAAVACLQGGARDGRRRHAPGRETPFAQSYRAEWTYFLAVIKGDVNAPPPRDQLALHRVLDAVYRSADEGRDVLL